MATTRTEHDSMGDVEVPADALWGAQTQRAVDNFPISGQRLDPALVHALALVKSAAAQANGALGTLDRDVASAIAAAADEVAAGSHDDHFPVDVFQTGSGTSSNMNANEVIARLSSASLGRAVHPNDHVNASQSSNDVFPTAIHVAVAASISTALRPALVHLRDSLAAKATELADVVTTGRTHLMDATPITLGQRFGGYARSADLALGRLDAALPRLCELPLGGTAVGTGLNAPAGFAAKAIDALRARTGLPLTEAVDHVEAQGQRDGLVETSATLRTIVLGLTKLANDVRWMASGPLCGLAEIHLPDLQPGSSIMPGKVNPVLPEALLQVCAQVVGNDAAVAFAAAQGNFELNVMLPVMARNLLESVRLLTNAVTLFTDRCLVGITADVERCRRYAELSPSVATGLNPLLGYEVVAGLVKESLRTGRTVRELVLDRDLAEPDAVDRALDVMALTGRNLHDR